MKLLPPLALIAFPLLSVLPAQAAFNPAIVPADAKWVAYADLNTLRNSTLGKELVGIAEKMQREQTDGKIGLDLPKILATIGSATAYGTNFANKPEEMDGALIVQGTADLRKIAEGLLVQQSVLTPNIIVEITDLPFPAYGVKSAPRKAPKPAAKDGATAEAPKAAEPTAPAGEPGKIEIVIAFPPEPIVLVSRSKAQLVKARDLFRGNGSSLAKAPNSPLKRFTAVTEDSYLFAASLTPPDKVFEGDTPQARVLKMASSGALALGEHGPETFARIDLVAASDAMAEKLMKILQGMTAMLSMAETNDRQLGEFLNAANVTRTGEVVTLNLTYPSARLVQMVQNFNRPAPVRTPGAPNRSTPQPSFGRTLAEWNAAPTPGLKEGAAPVEAFYTIADVELKNGSVLTLAREMNGARVVKFNAVEISQAGGAPLTFKPEFMRTVGRNGAAQFQFPGADGKYSVKILYSLNDPEGRTKFMLSYRDPRPATPPPAPAK